MGLPGLDKAVRKYDHSCTGIPQQSRCFLSFRRWYSCNSSPRPIRGVDCPIGTLVGRNFFDEVVGFEDISEVRRRFDRFVRGRTAADSFSVRCLAGAEPTKAKVMMTRTYQPGYYSPSAMVMFEIKEVDIYCRRKLIFNILLDIYRCSFVRKWRAIFENENDHTRT